MNRLGISYLIAASLVAVLGLTVFSKRAGSQARLVFVSFCLSICFWMFGYSMMQLSGSYRLFWAKVGHAGAIFVPITYLHFVMWFLELSHLKMTVKIYYLIGFISSVLLFACDWCLPTIRIYSWGVYPIGGPVMWIDFLLLLACISYSWVMFFIRCYQAHRNGRMGEYNRLKYGCLGMTILSIGGFDYLPKITPIQFQPFGFITTAIFVCIITYAILRTQLMDLNFVLVKTTVYSILAAFITAIYLTLILLMERFFQGALGYRSIIASLLVGFLIALGFNPLKEFVQRFIDRLFFKGTQAMLAQENDRLRQELVQSEKFKAVSTLAAGMAHEIKNPLTSLKTFAQYLPQKYDDPEYREKFSRIVEQEVDKMNGLVQRLLEFARPSAPQLRDVRLGQVVSEALELIQEKLLRKQVKVSRALEYQEIIQADNVQLKQALLNILLNSLDAVAVGGRITISASRTNGTVHISVQDTGQGIPKASLSRVLDPFYTTKPDGTGLGLTVVDSIVRAHGGRMSLESEEGIGTTVSLTLPLKGGDHG